VRLSSRILKTVLIGLAFSSICRGSALAGELRPVGSPMSEVKSPPEDDRVAKLLEMAQLAHQHRVAQVQSGGGSKPLYSQRPSVLRLSSRRSLRSLARIISAAPSPAGPSVRLRQEGGHVVYPMTKRARNLINCTVVMQAFKCTNSNESMLL